MINKSDIVDTKGSFIICKREGQGSLSCKERSIFVIYHNEILIAKKDSLEQAKLFINALLQQSARIVYREEPFYVKQVGDAWPFEFWVYSDNNPERPCNKKAYLHKERAIYKLKTLIAEQYVGKLVKHELCTYRIKHSRNFPRIYDVHIEQPYRFVHYGSEGKGKFDDILKWIFAFKKGLLFKREYSRIVEKINNLL